MLMPVLVPSIDQRESFSQCCMEWIQSHGGIAGSDSLAVSHLILHVHTVFPVSHCVAGIPASCHKEAGEIILEDSGSRSATMTTGGNPCRLGFDQMMHAFTLCVAGHRPFIPQPWVFRSSIHSWILCSYCRHMCYRAWTSPPTSCGRSCVSGSPSSRQLWM